MISAKTAVLLMKGLVRACVGDIRSNMSAADAVTDLLGGMSMEERPLPEEMLRRESLPVDLFGVNYPNAPAARDAIRKFEERYNGRIFGDESEVAEALCACRG